ncbi:MAG: zinc ribbon domain-containing protein [Candidatus Bathyarchaeota archaeon]|nr:zinc ribbon domain-containing protein [Candidatus Bathyarchaeota archaeon]
MQISDLVIQWKAAAASYLPEALNIAAIVLIIVTAVLLSIFMVLLLKTKKKIKLAKSNQKTAEVLCWKCKQKNTSAAKFCRACGAKLLSTASAPSSVACPKCGASNSSTARFCRKCGKPLK